MSVRTHLVIIAVMNPKTSMWVGAALALLATASITEADGQSFRTSWASASSFQQPTSKRSSRRTTRRRN
jgi:hypothetical protein